MSADSALNSFIESIRGRQLAVVEDAEVVLSKIRSNVGGFERNFPCVLQVSSKGDLQGIVEEANRWQVPIVPYSRGLNWGYGSKLPARSGCALLDLSRLDQIVKIDEEHGIATIEPGVSQKQLADELSRRGSRYYLDVTGSGAETSVIGNALERGIAYGSLRVQQLTGMEVLLGNGKQFRTGFGSFPNPALAGLYSYGWGPSLDGLFFQSNFGIVLEGNIQLSLRPEKLIGLTITIKAENIPAFIDRARDLLRDGSLHGIPHLANRERTVSTIVPLVSKQADVTPAEARNLVNRVVRGDWMLTAAIAGPPAIVNEKLRHVRKAVGGLGRVYTHVLIRPSWIDRLKTWCLDRILNREQRTVIKAAEPLRGFHMGKPSDAGIQFLLDSSNNSVDENPEGFLLCTPLAPLSGDSSTVFVRVAEGLAAKHRVRFAMTLNMLTGRVLEAVISIHFSRSSADEKARAHACVDELTAAFSKEGFYPYRANIDQQRRFAASSPVLTEVTGSIKSALDPNGIIAPGRYETQVMRSL